MCVVEILSSSTLKSFSSLDSKLIKGLVTCRLKCHSICPQVVYNLSRELEQLDILPFRKQITATEADRVAYNNARAA